VAGSVSGNQWARMTAPSKEVMLHSSPPLSPGVAPAGDAFNGAVAGAVQVLDAAPVVEVVSSLPVVVAAVSVVDAVDDPVDSGSVLAADVEVAITLDALGGTTAAVESVDDWSEPLLHAAPITTRATRAAPAWRTCTAALYARRSPRGWARADTLVGMANDPSSQSRPASPLWGHETELALANFDVSGQPLPIAIVHALAAIKAEAAAVNGARKTGDDAPRFAAIAVAAARVEAGEFDDHFLIDIFQTGSGTSTNMNVNEVVARLAADACGLAVHPNDDVNAGQSSNDTFPTAVTLAAVLAIDRELLPAIALVTESLRATAARFATVVKAGRTHMMDAVPIFLGDEFDGYAAQLAEAGERIRDSLPRVGRVPLGGTAVGTGLNTDPEFGATVVARLAARCNVDLSIAPSRFAAQASRDGLVEASSHLRGLAVALMKVANDIRLMASGPSTGLGELRLPELQAGSSIMPGKVNPVMCEMVTQVAIQVFGNDAAIAFAGSQGAFELNTYQPVIGANLLSSVRLLSRACTLFATRCVDGIEADVERCAFYAGSTRALATKLNGALGYDHVSKIVKQAVAERRAVLDVVVADGTLAADQAADLLDPQAIARGNRSAT